MQNINEIKRRTVLVVAMKHHTLCVCLWWVTGSVLGWEMSALLNTVLTWTCGAGGTGCGLHGWNALMYTHNTCVSYLVQSERWSSGLWRRSWRWSRSQWCTAVFHTCSRTEDHRPVQRERERGIGAPSSWHDILLFALYFHNLAGQQSHVYTHIQCY